MAVNCQLMPGVKHNRYELLAWLNTSLQTRFTKVEQTCSGAAFCQMMDCLFPGSVDLSQVQFQPRHDEDSVQNYSVLQAAFKKTGLVQSIPVKELVQGNLDMTLDFLIWFKAFFDANPNPREYNALEARGGQSMMPITPASTPAASTPVTSTPATSLTPAITTQLTLNESKAAGSAWQRSKDLSALSRPPIKIQVKSKEELETKAEGDEVKMDKRIAVELKVDRERADETRDLDGDEKIDDENVERTDSGLKPETGERTAGKVETKGMGSVKEGETVEGGRKVLNLETEVRTNRDEIKRKRGEETAKEEDDKTGREEDERKVGKSPEKEEAKMMDGEEGKRTEKEEAKMMHGEEGKRTEKEEAKMMDGEEGKRTEKEEAKMMDGEEGKRTEKEEAKMMDGEEGKRTEKEEAKMMDGEEGKRTEKEEAKMMDGEEGKRTEKEEAKMMDGEEGKRTEKEEAKMMDGEEGKRTEKEEAKMMDGEEGKRTEKEEAKMMDGEEGKRTERKDGEEDEMEEDGMTEGEQYEKEKQTPLSRCSLVMQRFLKHWLEKNQELRQGLGQVQEEGLVQGQGEGLAGGSSGSTFRHVLGSNYPHDIVHTLLHTPYTLYVYRHVDVGAEQSVCLLLIGYYHQKLGVRMVRLLEALQPKDNTSTALLICLRGTLTRLGLPLTNLAWFYCDVAGREEQASLEAEVQEMSPRMMSLCGMPGLAGSACQAGVSQEVVELVVDIHRQCSTFNPTHDSLKQLFASVPEMDPNVPVATQCLFFTRMVQAIAHGWEDLLGYFSSLGGEGEALRIHACLRHSGLRLKLLFLSHALEPLAAFEDAVQGGRLSLEGILQVAGTLLLTYCARFLRPYSTDFLLCRRSSVVLNSKTHYLDGSKVDIGGARVQDFLSESVANPEDVEAARSRLVDAAIAFYCQVTRCLFDSLPLSKVALKHVAALLQPAWKEEDVGWRVARQVAWELGVCSSFRDRMGGDTDRLLGEYHEYVERPLAPSPPGKVGKVEEAERHWGRVLEGLERGSVFRGLMLTLLALPRSLQRDAVLPKAFENRYQVLAERLKAESEEKTTPFPLPGPRIVIVSDSDDSVTEVTWTPGKLNSSNATPLKASESVMVADDEEDNVIWTPTFNSQPEQQHIAPSVTSTPEPPARKNAYYQDDGGYDVGELVWGRMEGCSLWPGVVCPWESGPGPRWARRVEWYQEGMFSEISTLDLHPFSAFSQHFCANSFATLITYRDAIFKFLQVAAKRCRQAFCPESDKREEELRLMLNWAFGGFKPCGPRGFAPPPYAPDKTEDASVNSSSKSLPSSSASNKNTYGSSLSLPTELRKVSVSLKKLSLCLLKGGSVRLSKHQRPRVRPRKRPQPVVSIIPQEEDCPSPDWQPPHKRTSSYYKAKESRHIYVQPDPKHREAMVREVMEAGAAIEEFCLCCGANDYNTQHPLFEGGLCTRCKDNFTETLHQYDEDGYQSYCTICCSGLEVILCGNDSCSRSYCVDCVNILVGSKTFESLKEVDPWICYLCQPSQRHGALKPRHDWSMRVQAFFFNDSAMEFEPHRVYPSIPASKRRPIRVLSLFDGIATGYLVLKELGFKVQAYIASEVCEESIAVSTINHEGRITQVDDVRAITMAHLKKWGPFDLLIGGSPCNDLSIVNPIRKGLYEGTGRLFFEYYRILDLLKPKENNPRPFFWLFENVVFMNNHDRLNICRYLECNPVVVDAVKVSPAHRARCFWGNIPGMNRPIVASKNDKLVLQDCLEFGRTAQFSKVRTITTNPASMKQGRDMSKLPVLDENMKEDTLWITELEQIFGFPRHYTDVKNMNRQQRQKVLGKSWSVPVIRHLFAPLKDYFACEQLPP